MGSASILFLGGYIMGFFYVTVFNVTLKINITLKCTIYLGGSFSFSSESVSEQELRYLQVTIIYM